MTLLVLRIYIEVLQHIFLKKVIAEVRETLNMNGGLYLLLWGIPACALGGNTEEDISKVWVVSQEVTG